jgi:hypothetical protein
MTKLTLEEQLEIIDMFLNEQGLCTSFEDYVDSKGYKYTEFNLEE